MADKQAQPKSRVNEISAKSIAWEDDADRLILYADIMGFSHRVTKNNHNDLKTELLKFKQAWENRIKPLQTGGHLRSVQFSDSTLIVVNGTDEKMFNLISKAAICLMQSAISLGFPIKGVLAQGNFTYDKENQIYFGLPLVEAYQLHEEIYYYGIVVHHSAEQTVKKYMGEKKPYTKTEVNLKKGKTSHYHLSWHLLDKKLSPGNIKESVNKWLDKIEESVSGAPRIYVDNTRKVVDSDDNEWQTISAENS
ncbi:MAG: hypothetical protein LBL13_11060 [Bacteroidales bacterium]|jgi:hypothetical protein|nr:hypothetical protein [Bacteroidales bacterium]